MKVRLRSWGVCIVGSLAFLVPGVANAPQASAAGATGTYCTARSSTNYHTFGVSGDSITVTVMQCRAAVYRNGVVLQRGIYKRGTVTAAPSNNWRLPVKLTWRDQYGYWTGIMRFDTPGVISFFDPFTTGPAGIVNINYARNFQAEGALGLNYYTTW